MYSIAITNHLFLLKYFWRYFPITLKKLVLQRSTVTSFKSSPVGRQEGQRDKERFLQKSGGCVQCCGTLFSLGFPVDCWGESPQVHSLEICALLYMCCLQVFDSIQSGITTPRMVTAHPASPGVQGSSFILVAPSIVNLNVFFLLWPFFQMTRKIKLPFTPKKRTLKI